MLSCVEEPRVEDQALWDCRLFSQHLPQDAFLDGPTGCTQAIRVSSTKQWSQWQFSSPSLHGLKSQSIFSSFPCLHIELVAGSFLFLLNSVFKAALTLVDLLWVSILASLQTLGFSTSNPPYTQMSKPIFFAFGCYPTTPLLINLPWLPLF